MEIKIPGLSDAMGKLEHTNQQMDRLVLHMEKVVQLLEAQNEILRNTYDQYIDR